MRNVKLSIMPHDTDGAARLPPNLRASRKGDSEMYGKLRSFSMTSPDLREIDRRVAEKVMGWKLCNRKAR